MKYIVYYWSILYIIIMNKKLIKHLIPTQYALAYFYNCPKYCSSGCFQSDLSQFELEMKLKEI